MRATRLSNVNAAFARLLFVAAALLAAPTWQNSSVLYGDDWLPITPAELKMTSEPQAPGASAIYLYRQVDRDDVAGHEIDYARIKILTDEGRKYGDVEIAFLQKISSVNGVRARTIQPDGTVANFDGKVYVKNVVKAKGFSFVAKTFTLPNVQVGTIIEYRYTIDWDSHLIYDSRWVLSEELFTKHAIFSLKPYTQFSLNTSWPRGLPPGTAPPTVKQGQPIRLESQNIPAVAVEDYMPPELETKYRIDFVYSDAPFEKDYEKFWSQEAKRRFSKVEEFAGKRKAMEQAVTQVVAAGDAPEVKLQKIYAKCQQIRDLDYESDKTQQERDREKLKGVKSVEDVWKLGYGSGIQITWLFLGLARAAGFDAYPVLVSRRNEYFFNPHAMNPNELNDAIVLVNLDGKERYFDPGSMYVPYGLLPWSETAVQGLKLTKDGGVWLKTTVPSSSASRVERTASLQMDEKGALTGTLAVVFTGLKAQQLRVNARDADVAERKKQLEDEVKGWIPVEVEVSLKNSPDWDSSSDRLQADFELAMRGWATSSGRRAFFALGLFSGQTDHLFESADRVHPVYFKFPWQEKDDIRVRFPLEWSIASVPPVKKLDLKAAAFETAAANDAGVLHIKRDMNVDILLLDVKYYGSLRTFFQELRTSDQQQVLLQAGKGSPGN